MAKVEGRCDAEHYEQPESRLRVQRHDHRSARPRALTATISTITVVFAVAAATAAARLYCGVHISCFSCISRSRVGGRIEGEHASERRPRPPACARPRPGPETRTGVRPMPGELGAEAVNEGDSGGTEETSST